jgi:hypothetical protein
MSQANSYLAELVGAFGDPIAENPTGVMQEAAFRALDLNWRYLTIEVHAADLPAAVAGMRAMNFRGINLTIPHKVAVLPHLDEIAPDAGLIGAVNTVRREGATGSSARTRTARASCAPCGQSRSTHEAGASSSWAQAAPPRRSPSSWHSPARRTSPSSIGRSSADGSWWMGSPASRAPPRTTSRGYRPTAFRTGRRSS